MSRHNTRRESYEALRLQPLHHEYRHDFSVIRPLVLSKGIGHQIQHVQRALREQSPPGQHVRPIRPRYLGAVLLGRSTLDDISQRSPLIAHANTNKLQAMICDFLPASCAEPLSGVETAGVNVYSGRGAGHSQQVTLNLGSNPIAGEADLLLDFVNRLAGTHVRGTNGSSRVIIAHIDGRPVTRDALAAANELAPPAVSFERTCIWTPEEADFN